MRETFLDDRVVLHAGDMLAVLPTLAENLIDSCVCDPPYHLTSIVKRFGAENAKPAQFGSDGRYARASAGFMGKVWDGGDIAARPESWREVYRVLKPGAHLLAFGGTRTFHRMACAIEDAGFEIRDTILWLYGSGFPKSHDVSKAIDRAAEFKRPVVGRSTEFDISAAASLFSAAWDGWGTALKPACEPIILARKPLAEGTIAANVLKWGTGALNIDGCRVEGQARPFGNGTARSAGIMGESEPRGAWESTVGRWPANVIHDGSDEVLSGFPDLIGRANKGTSDRNADVDRTAYGQFQGNGDCGERFNYDAGGSAARFFYTAKADADDRLGSKHPTVKPLDLIQYLIRLVTPRGGLVLDPFAGTGTTGEAAWREGMRAVLIEREEQYCADIRRRMALVLSSDRERVRATIKASGKTEAPGPLFTWEPAP